MEPLSIIVGALVAGAAAGATDVASQAVKEAYAGLKALIVQRFSSGPDVAESVEKVEKQPEAEHRQAYLKGELQNAGADKDAEIVQQAQALLDLLKKEGMLSDAQYQIIVSGSGAAAVAGGIAAGEGGVAAQKIEGGVSLGGSRPKRPEENDD
jgi:hypothetical protein